MPRLVASLRSSAEHRREQRCSTITEMSDRPRPNARRNLLASFDAIPSDVDAEPPEVAENRENIFVENQLNSSAEAFKARWGYDVIADCPVENSDWEWTPVEREMEARPPVDAGAREVAGNPVLEVVQRGVDVDASPGEDRVEEGDGNTVSDAAQEKGEEDSALRG